MTDNQLKLKMLQIKKKLLKSFVSKELTPIQVKKLFYEYIKLDVVLYNSNPTSIINKKRYDNGNCYSFALDIPTPSIFVYLYDYFEIDDFYINPGFCSELSKISKSKEERINSFKMDLDKLNIKYYETRIDNPNRLNGYKIAILQKANNIHFIRQNTDYTWSEKIGYNSLFETFDSIKESHYLKKGYLLDKTYEIVKPKILK